MHICKHLTTPYSYVNQPISKQLYKEELADFRSTALPRQFSQTFSEAPDSNVIRDKLANLNSRYEKLKDRCLCHRDKLGAVMEKQEKYHTTVDPMLPWIDETQVKLSKMLREPIAAEPAAVQNQIDQLKVSELIYLQSADNMLLKKC